MCKGGHKMSILFCFCLLTWCYFVSSAVSTHDHEKRLLLTDPDVVGRRLTELENALQVFFYMLYK